MSVDEISRIRLAQSAAKALGEAEAMTLMEHLPIGGIENLATKDDLALTRAELRADLAELRGDFGELRGEFGELKGEFGTLRGDFGDLRAYIEERFHRQTITFVGTMTGIMGLMMAFVKWA